MTLQVRPRIGVLTSGGDAPGLNAVIRAIVKAAHCHGWDVLGFEDGYEGLLSNSLYRILTEQDVRGLLRMGGTILGTTNKGHFVGRNPSMPAEEDPYVQAVQSIQDMGLQGIIAIGGEGTQNIAYELSMLGAPIVGVPKTIDNDLAGTDRTFGFDTALQVATEALDRLHTTAASHNRVMVMEVMGRHAGWIALHGGIAGGADVILIPEIPFHMEEVAAKVMERQAQGRRFSTVVVAEGAYSESGDLLYQAEGRLGGMGAHVANQLQKITGKDTRVVVLGHLQRGGSPSPYDRILSTRFGSAAVFAIANREFGTMVALRGQSIVNVPLTEVCGKMKTVPPDSDIVSCARSLGISFGDGITL